METEVIKLLISSCQFIAGPLAFADVLRVRLTDYNITKRTIIDTVPKAIMLSLVSHSKEDLQKELLAELYIPQAMDELLKVRAAIQGGIELMSSVCRRVTMLSLDGRNASRWFKLLRKRVSRCLCFTV